MATVLPRQTERQEEEHPGDGMVAIAERIERYHIAPVPGAAEALPNPFPPIVTRGLWLGAILGGVVGLLFGVLLSSGTLVVPGWEQLFSVGTVTFSVLWTLFGVAAGILTVGVGAILMASPEPYDPDPTRPGSREAGNGDH